jgi:hypothetical protein
MPAHTGRAVSPCWSTCSHAGGAKRSCWSCSGLPPTDFVITITLSAADATAHIIGNPFVPSAFNHPIGVTLLLIGLLAAVFLKGFKEAIGLAVAIVLAYLVLNVVVIVDAAGEVWRHPNTWRGGGTRWRPNMAVRCNW